jgi:ribonuclease HII
MSRVLGIDEAGKGCIIGPLVIGVVIIEDDEQLSRLGVKDSKVLKKDQREALYEDIPMCVETYQIVEVPAAEIDRALADPNSNLNQLEADHFVEIINKHNPDVAIIDCPSPNIRAYHQYIYERLDQKSVTLKCMHKADAKFDVVAAASIMAKVTRDREIDTIKKKVGVDFGSGYLSDEKTQTFLKKHWKTHAQFFRKSWKPYRDIVSAQSQMTLGNF